MTIKALINVPRLDLPGGVANYYRVLRPYLGDGKSYFEVGSKSGESDVRPSLARLTGDYWRFHRRLSKERFTLVHLNPSLGTKSLLRDAVFLLIARAHSTPVLVLFHGWDNELQARIAKRYRRIFGFVFNKASAIVVLARAFENQLRELGISVPIHRLSTCVEDSVFEIPFDGRQSKPDTNILYLSRLDRGKGVIEAIRAFATLPLDQLSVTLTIAGDGPERPAAEKLVKELSLTNVEFLGHIEGTRKVRAFVDADIFFFPTFYGEGMPTTILEAMAYGLPIVTRAVGGLRDFFENEKMGFISDSNDVRDFGRSLSQLIRSSELRDRIGRYNRDYSRINFSTSAVAMRLENLYAELG